MIIARQASSKRVRANVIDRSAHPLRGSDGQRGFAMLVLMLMAAAVAFSLYLQMPRYAFETVRQREQLLMDRGNQYKRAIQVYYADNKHYPAKLEDLEHTNDKRYLRRRYRDPLTGSDEWRLIHTNGSALTDSLVQKPVQNAANGTPGTGGLPGAGPLGANVMNTGPFGTAFPGQPGVTGQPGVPGANGDPNNPGQPQPVNSAVLRRPSDRLTAGMPTPAPGLPQNPGQDNGLVPGLYPPGYNPSAYNPNDPSTWPPITLAPTGQQGQPGQGQPAGFPGGVTPGVVNQGFNQGFNQGLNQGTNQGAQNAQQPVTIPGFGPQNTANPQVTQITSSFPDQSQGVVQTPLPFGPQADPFNNAPGAVQPVTPAQTGIPGQGPGLGGQNTQIYNPSNGFAGNPLAPDAAAQAGIPQGVGSLQQSLVPAQLNPALQTINSQLSGPTSAAVAPLTNSQMQNSPQMSPGIAGVASKYEGASIKVYNKRSKYKEWEFVFDPSTSTTGSALPQTGQQNGLGTIGTNTGTNGTGAFNIPGFSSGPGQSPQPGLPQQNAQPGQFNSTPSSNPFGQPSNNPFGAPTQ